MIERLTHYPKEALHIGRCIFELGVLALKEVAYVVDEARDCWGEDSPEDQAIPSSINQEGRAA